MDKHTNKINIEKVSNRMILLCWCTIILCTILKLFGYKQFEIPMFNDNINIWLQRLINLFLYDLNSIMFLLLLIKRKPENKEFILTILLSSCLFVLSLFDNLAVFKLILEPLIYFGIGMFIIKDKWYKILIETIVIYLVFTVYQGLTLIYKSFNINLSSFSFIPSLILQIDYYSLMILTIIYCFKKGGYIYGYWQSFMDFLSKRKCDKEVVRQDQTKVPQEIGYKIFLVVLSITQIFLVGTICYFINNVILEYFIVIIAFFIMRQVFGKSYHADSVLACTTLSVIVFTLATRLTLPQWCSILCNIFIGCMVAYVMYMWYYYAKYTHATGITICKGMSKDNLIALSEFYNWTELEFNILCDYYVYIIRLECIAHKYDYSVDNIKKIKAKALKKLT